MIVVYAESAYLLIGNILLLALVEPVCILDAILYASGSGSYGCGYAAVGFTL